MKKNVLKLVAGCLVGLFVAAGCSSGVCPQGMAGSATDACLSFSCENDEDCDAIVESVGTSCGSTPYLCQSDGHCACGVPASG